MLEWVGQHVEWPKHLSIVSDWTSEIDVFSRHALRNAVENETWYSTTVNSVEQVSCSDPDVVDPSSMARRWYPWLDFVHVPNPAVVWSLADDGQLDNDTAFIEQEHEVSDHLLDCSTSLVIVNEDPEVGESKFRRSAIERVWTLGPTTPASVERDISSDAEASGSESLSSIRLFAAFDRVDGRDAEVLAAALARAREGELGVGIRDGEAVARVREGEGAARVRDGEAGRRVADGELAAGAREGDAGAVGRVRDGEAAVALVRGWVRSTSSRARSCSRLRWVIGGTVSP